jgi:hypothetical protein
MANAYVYGPYWVLNLSEAKLQPGEVRTFGFGPWPTFGEGTTTISANVQDFSGGGLRAITIDSLQYALDGTQRYVYFTYRNTGTEPIQGWYFNLSVVVP